MIQVLFSAVALTMVILLAVDQGRWHRLSRGEGVAVLGVALGLVIAGVLIG
jgi:hypothetical protein